MNFYKNVIEHRGKLLVRGILEGKEYRERIDFQPTLYAITQQETEFKTLNGQCLNQFNLEVYLRQEILKKLMIQITHQSMVWIVININIFQMNFLMTIVFSKEHIKIFTVDIECSAENGFPDVENPTEEILAITVKNQSNKQIITWGTGDFKSDRLDVTYV
jgi:hypothetical protein